MCATSSVPASVIRAWRKWPWVPWDFLRQNNSRSVRPCLLTMTNFAGRRSAQTTRCSCRKVARCGFRCSAAHQNSRRTCLSRVDFGDAKLMRERMLPVGCSTASLISPCPDETLRPCTLPSRTMNIRSSFASPRKRNRARQTLPGKTAGILPGAGLAVAVPSANISTRCPCLCRIKITRVLFGGIAVLAFMDAEAGHHFAACL